MKSVIEEFDLEKIVGGIKISRQSTNSGKVYYNGKEYPFTNYSGLVKVAQDCVASGTYDDDTLFKAFQAAGLI